MAYYCPHCSTPVNFPELDTSTKIDLSDLMNTRMQKVKEKPIRCSNPTCAKWLVKAECKSAP